MSSVATSELFPLVFIILLIVLIYARRIVSAIRGTRYSVAGTFSLGVFVLVVFAVFGAGTIALAVHSWGAVAFGLVPAYAAVVLVTTIASMPAIVPLVKFEARDAGPAFYTLPAYIPAVSLGLFLVRLISEFLVLGPGALSFVFPASLSLLPLLALVTVDLLFGISAGLLLGRGWAIRRAHSLFVSRRGDALRT